MTVAAALDSSSPNDLANRIDSSLKSLLVLVGQSLKARSRLQTTLQLVQDKAATSSAPLSKEELILLQHYQSGHTQSIPGLKEIERKCFLYDGLVKDLGRWVGSAKNVLEQEVTKAKAREEAERIIQEQRELEFEAMRIAEENEKAKAAEKSNLTAENKADANQANEPIVIDDDEDDAPLAKRTTTGEQNEAGAAPNNAAIDRTDDSPLGGKTIPLASENATAPPPNTNVSALLNSFSGFNQANLDSAVGSSSMALDKFDFSQFGLQNMDPSTGFSDNTLSNQFQSDSLDFNMDFLDYSALGGADGGTAGDGGMGNSNDLFSNIDFSALLGGNTETKKEKQS